MTASRYRPVIAMPPVSDRRVRVMERRSGAALGSRPFLTSTKIRGSPSLFNAVDCPHGWVFIGRQRPRRQRRAEIPEVSTCTRNGRHRYDMSGLRALANTEAYHGAWCLDPTPNRRTCPTSVCPNRCDRAVLTRCSSSGFDENDKNSRPARVRRPPFPAHRLRT